MPRRELNRLRLASPLFTHSIEACLGEVCCIHAPSEHHMVDWPQHWRGDIGIMERICPHGIGHPDPDDRDYRRRKGLDARDMHGCDGCCSLP